MFQIYNPFCMCKIDGFAEGSDRFSDISTGGQGFEWESVCGICHIIPPLIFGPLEKQQPKQAGLFFEREKVADENIIVVATGHRH